MQQTLENVGRTVRHRRTGTASPHHNGVHCALIVGSTVTCHFWLNILPLAADPALRYFITVDDLQAVVDRLHVRPTVIPAFLVFCPQGFPIDWFAAPLPGAGEAVEHGKLLQAVRQRLRAYE